MIESKFELLTASCPDQNKARFAAQQLRGSARLWWDHYHAMLLADHVVSWNEFKTTFRGHHYSTSSWLLPREAATFCTTRKLSTTCAATPAITQIPTKRR